MTDVQIRRRRIEAQLYAEGPISAEHRLQRLALDDLRHPPGEEIGDRVRRHARDGTRRAPPGATWAWIGDRW